MTPRFRLGFLTHVEGRGALADTYRNAQELFVAADELGFDVGWVAQHHLPIGGGGLPSPWTFLASAAARTSRIRLGTAVTILPLENPIRLAEDVSVVDLLSGGRVEIGVGSGYGPLEYAALGVDFEAKRELTTQGLAVLRAALANEEVGTEGFRIQPPTKGFADRIWQGVFSKAGAGYAAAAGSNLLLNRATYGYREPTDEVQRPWAQQFLDAWGRPHRPRVGLSRFVFPAKDRRTALDQIREGVLRGARGFVDRGQFPAGLSLEEYLFRFHAFYGHPDEIVEALQKEQALPLATDLITQFNPGVPDHDAALQALELIATQVAPELGWSPVDATAAQVDDRPVELTAPRPRYAEHTGPPELRTRGTVLVVAGRGETTNTYRRLGERLAHDSYRVRVLPSPELDADDIEGSLRRFAAELVVAAGDAHGEDGPVRPLVLVGADTGAVAIVAALAQSAAGSLPRTDALVLAGLPGYGARVPAAAEPWEAELDVRAHCPAHRRVLGDDPGFVRGQLDTPLPDALLDAAYQAGVAVPQLLLVGDQDPLADQEELTRYAKAAPSARLTVVHGAHHDVLNDLQHRSVAAAVVTFLEALRADEPLQPIVDVASSAW